MKTSYLYIISALLFVACETEASDQEKMEDEVRSYYFLDDTADVSVTVTDTLYMTSVEEMLANTDKNLVMIQMDIDTLLTMIDDLSYKILADSQVEIIATGSTLSSNTFTVEEYRLLSYEVKQGQLQAQKIQYIHTRRVLQKLKRDSWADVGGFNATVTFTKDGAPRSDEVMFSGAYRIID